ncbi:MAG: DUF2634 domain-containing protein [Methanomicrobiales archaeon]|nr:DUF2634 domain-containing protein [Methanomicrobiales archaeon]
MTEEELLGSDLELRIQPYSVTGGIGIDLFVGRGGDLSMATGRANLGQALLHRLLTRRGELADIGHPDYGSRLYELIGEPNNPGTRERVKLYVKEAVAQEIRVKDVIGIEVLPLREDPSVVTVELTVVPIESTVPMNLVFPFYLEVV